MGSKWCTVHRKVTQDKDKAFVEFIIRELVNHPVHKEDMGLLIGRSGSTAKAIRALVRIVGMRNNARVNLRIEEPEGSEAAASVGSAGKTRDVEDVMNDLGNL